MKSELNKNKVKLTWARANFILLLINIKYYLVDKSFLYLSDLYSPFKRYSKITSLNHTISTKYHMFVEYLSEVNFTIKEI